MASLPQPRSHSRSHSRSSSSSSSSPSSSSPFSSSWVEKNQHKLNSDANMETINTSDVAPGTARGARRASAPAGTLDMPEVGPSRGFEEINFTVSKPSFSLNSQLESETETNSKKKSPSAHANASYLHVKNEVDGEREFDGLFEDDGELSTEAGPKVGCEAVEYDNDEGKNRSDSLSSSESLPFPISQRSPRNEEGSTTTDKSSGENLYGESRLKFTCTLVQTRESTKSKVLVTVRAPAVAAEDEQTHRRKRKPIDLVAVLDTSGSVAGAPEELLRRSLGFLVQQLCADESTNICEGDRLAVVTFADEAKVILPLTRMNSDGKSIAETVISRIKAGGGTNLSAGVFRGLDIVETRTDARPVTSVLLLTDGLSNRGVLDASRLKLGVEMALQRIGAPTSLFTFGVGDTHDANGLVEMARASAGGVYSFLEGAEEIPASLEKCIGGLFSVLAQNVRVHYDPLKFTPLEPWRAHVPGVLDIGDMYMAEQKRFVLVKRSSSSQSNQQRKQTRQSLVSPSRNLKQKKQKLSPSSTHSKHSKTTRIQDEANPGVGVQSAFRLEYLDVATMCPCAVEQIAHPPATTAQAAEVAMHVASLSNLALALQAMTKAALQTGLHAHQSALDASLSTIRNSSAFEAGDPMSGRLVAQLEFLSAQTQNEKKHRRALLSLSNQYELQRVLTTSLTSSSSSSSNPPFVTPHIVAQPPVPTASALTVSEVAAALEACSVHTNRSMPSSQHSFEHGSLPSLISTSDFPHDLERTSRTALPSMSQFDFPVAHEIHRSSTAPVQASYVTITPADMSTSNRRHSSSSADSARGYGSASSDGGSPTASRWRRHTGRLFRSSSARSAPTPSDTAPHENEQPASLQILQQHEPEVVMQQPVADNQSRFPRFQGVTSTSLSSNQSLQTAHRSFVLGSPPSSGSLPSPPPLGNASQANASEAIPARSRRSSAETSSSRTSGVHSLRNLMAFFKPK